MKRLLLLLLILPGLCLSGCTKLSEEGRYNASELEAIAGENIRADYNYTEYGGILLRQTGFEAGTEREDSRTLTYIYEVRTRKLPKSVNAFSIELVIENGEILNRSYTKLREEEYPSLFSGEIIPQDISVNSKRILLKGSSSLPEGTVLRSQLFANAEPEGWWPKNETVAVNNGKWKIEVALGEAGRPEKLDPQADYLLLVWKEDEPAVRSGMYFDLAGPPLPVD